MKYLLFYLFFLTAFSGSALCQRTLTKKTATKRVMNKTSNSQNSSPVLSPEVPQDLPVTYTFTGNGDWDNASNWENNLMPPPTTNNGSDIIINHISGGECLLNIPYVVTPGTNLTILAGKSLRLPGNLVVN